MSAEFSPWEVRRLLLEAAIAAPEIFDTPAPLARIVNAERRPIRYLASVNCAGYFEHFAAKEFFLYHAWQLLEEAGAEIAADTQQIHVRQSREIDFRPSADDEILAAVDLLNPLRPAEKKRLLKAGSIHELPPGAAIVRAGDEGQSFFVVLSGLVRIFRPAEDGAGPDLELARLGAGSYFGEMSLLTGERHSASISAHTRTRILEIPKSAMAQVLAQRPELAKKTRPNHGRAQTGKRRDYARPRRQELHRAAQPEHPRACSAHAEVLQGIAICEHYNIAIKA